MFQLQQVTHSVADAHWQVLRDGAIAGQCSLWWHNTPSYSGRTTGLIGHYQVWDENVAAVLLEQGCRELAKRGCGMAIAPMDGNTWNAYRLITDWGNEPPFFLEPQFPGAEPCQFVDAGFFPLAHYYSAITTDLTHQESRVQSVWQRLQAMGVTIRALDLTQLDSELAGIYQVAVRSFQHHLLYQPIAIADFQTQYQPLLPYIQPELVRIAEHQEHTVGFAFALPDWLEPQRGEIAQTVIFKTIAVFPDRRYAGLGQVLFEQIHTIAAHLGYRRVIHALMEETNPVCCISDRYAHPLRRYALFAKML